jgi:hypothetical protein
MADKCRHEMMPIGTIFRERLEIIEEVSTLTLFPTVEALIVRDAENAVREQSL